jgi:hypothetical protein
MDREEARRLLAEKLAEYRHLPYAKLVARIGNDEHLEVRGPSGTLYQIEIQFLWDEKKDGDVRVLAGIDDGSLRGAFRPLCQDFIVRADGQLVGE